MKIFAPKETDPDETRAALDPLGAKKLTDLGITVVVEAGVGESSGHLDQKYSEAGAEVTQDRNAALADADVVIRVRKPPAAEVGKLKKGAIHISFLDPFNEPDLIDAFAKANATAISLEMVPRTTLAQKMDALSSQANLAGYASVILAASRMKTILPMMMTPAGTIAPAKFFIVGIGVAGLQAIATAKRLGARVTAFDVRPEALEQAESLGAKALRIDLGETKSEGGYAKEMTPEQIKIQIEAQAKVCAQSDVVITTAKVFGRKPPVLVKKPAIDQMQNGSLIIDLAAEGGGNVEGIVAGEEVTTKNGVTLIGLTNYEGLVPQNATQVYSANITNMIEHFLDEESKSFPIDLEDEILKGCVITYDGKIVNERFTS
ncbi:MAG: NAD(P) transhydrogenase subunit alpha [Verrucomicrobiales bacterium]|nr:NAD(P) transhydrogenase subunit alpha [Verrucomicrobiales bacterium]